jgi:hypothetical protein
MGHMWLGLGFLLLTMERRAATSGDDKAPHTRPAQLTDQTRPAQLTDQTRPAQPWLPTWQWHPAWAAASTRVPSRTFVRCRCVGCRPAQ